MPSPVRVLWVEINETDWCTRASFFLLQLLICYTARLSDNNNLAEHPIINRSQGEYWRAVCTWHTHAHTARGSLVISIIYEDVYSNDSRGTSTISLIRVVTVVFIAVISPSPYLFISSRNEFHSNAGPCMLRLWAGRRHEALGRLSSCVCFEPSSAGTRRPSSLTQMRLSPVCAFVVRLRRLQLALRLSGGYTTAGAARFG